MQCNLQPLGLFKMLAVGSNSSSVAVFANGVAHKACSRPARLLWAQKRRAPQLHAQLQGTPTSDHA